MWEDLLLSRLVGAHALQAALAAAFGVEPERVHVVDDFADARGSRLEDLTLLAERTELSGDFPLLLSVAIHDQRLARFAEPPAARWMLTRWLSAALDCHILISDDDISPYTSLRVRPTGEVDAVRFDADALDEDRYVIAESTLIAARPDTGENAAVSAG